MKNIIIASILLIIIIGVVGCSNPSAEDVQSTKTNETLEQMNNKLGMPNITEFYEKDLLKTIYESRDKSKLICYAYKDTMGGKFIYLGKCMGFGIPYATQYTSSQKYSKVMTKDKDGYWHHDYQMIPQSEPNGLYMPDSASATWIMLINETTGKPQIMYFEPNLVVYQSKLPKRLCDESTLPTDY